METYARAHLSDSTLIASARRHRRDERGATAHLLADLGEMESRGLHRDQGHSSLFGWCRKELDLGEQAAFKRVRASRVARRFPQVLPMVADGRLHLTAVVMLSSHLTETTADELFVAVAHQSCKLIERLLAERFPRPDVPTVLRPIPSPMSRPAAEPEFRQLSSRTVVDDPARLEAEQPSAPVEVPWLSPAPCVSRVTPLGPQRFALQATINTKLEGLLREAHELLGYPTPTSHVSEVLEEAMEIYVEKLRKRKHGAADAPRPGRERHPDSRRIPNEVRQAVWIRDRGQCAFVSESGHRCEERSGLEYDHITPYARGGDSSVGNVRLLCPAHNQLEAERAFGAEFMRQKRAASA